MKHGQCKTSTYSAWTAMMRRCYTPSVPNFERWGGRGIRVCERWRDFRNFLADMGPRPTGLSLDRINNDGNYEPGNCRWATREQQGRNTATTRNITFAGKTQCLSDWAAEVGITPHGLYYRLQRGWPLERALTERVAP